MREKSRILKKSIGVDIGGTNLKTAIVMESGEYEHLSYRDTEARKGPKQIIRNLKLEIKKLLDLNNNIVGIGIGCAGQVKVGTGEVYDPPNFPNWHKENLKEIIEKEFGLTTFVDNDGTVAAFAESLFGAGRDSNYFMLVVLGTGVGAGLVFSKKIYHGSIGIAGEFGHFTVNFDGPQCKCGQNGCIERYVGSKWIVEQANQMIPQNPKSKLNELPEDEWTPKRISDLANAGDKLCIQVMNNVGTHLGIALGSIINLLNLDMIAIGGGISNAGSVLFDPMKKSLQKHSMSIPQSMVEIRRAELGEYAGIIGAGSMVFTN